MEHTPRNFALQLGALTALYVSLASLVTLLFSVVTLALPDPAERYWEVEQASESIRFAFASILIFFPAYLALTRYVNHIRRREDGGEYLTLTRWLIYLSLFVGGAILLGDAVAVVYSWLNGELTLRFFLKAAILAAVVKSAFFYYLLDARGYWQTHERYSLYAGTGATLLVVTSLGLGLYFMESPSEVREQRIDENQLSDLQNIQYHIQDYLLSNDTLPADLEAAYPVGEPPIAPAQRSPYRYERTGDGFELCAEFANASTEEQYAYPSRPMKPDENEQPYIENPDNWEYEAGEWCFERAVTMPMVTE
jgi:hypothetical protein